MRDTDSDWASLGQSEPYFGVLSHERFLRCNLTEETRAEFWHSGVHNIAAIRQHLINHFGEFTPRTAVDFGCGVGRLTRAMAAYSTMAIGIDVSPPMLTEARGGAPKNTKFQLDIPEGPIDWINSAIVFQHIPIERGYALFRQLLNVASPDAVLSVQFTLFKDQRAVADQYFPNVAYSTWDGVNLTPLLRKERPLGAMSMYDYDMNLLIALMVDAGFESYFIRHSNHAGAHGVEIYSKRGA